MKKECRHPDKGVAYDFFTIDTSNWINVVARTDGGDFILVRQHRLGSDEVTLETAGGLIEPGEQPESCARRELLEETGYECGSVHLLKRLAVNPAIMNNAIYIYYAGRCRKVADQRLDLAEDIEIVTCSEERIRDMIESGVIDHSIVVMALQLYFQSPLYDEVGSGALRPD
ncbi:MAG: NUDIX hydrolase [Spirochaetes bacterium]|nr:NUDIX hydrolase [Spirochaetota bacterium]